MAEVTTTAGRHFSTNDGETILDAALRQGVALQYSCRTGRCATCKARVLSGQTAAMRDELGLGDAESVEGHILTCVRTASSDLVLEVEDLGDAIAFPARLLPCRISVLERPAPDVVRALLRLPPNTRFGYYPGQSIDVFGPAGLRRSYSIANAPSVAGQLELHIRKVPGGAMSAYWFEQARENDLLRFRGPLGTFFLRGIGGKDLVFLATGTGIAPVKAMLEGLGAIDAEHGPRSIAVYWGGRLPADLYWDPDGIEVEHRFVPVLSRAGPEWGGARGHVQNVLMESQPDLPETVIYACGSDAMVREARTTLLAAGLPERNYRSDAFVPSGTG